PAHPAARRLRPRARGRRAARLGARRRRARRRPYRGDGHHVLVPLQGRRRDSNPRGGRRLGNRRALGLACRSRRRRHERGAAAPLLRRARADRLMADNRLTAFVEAALSRGAPREDIEQALAGAGWSRAQIRDGLGRFADIDFVVPVPQPRAELSARDAFVYLVMFSTLYFSAYQLGNLLFQLIHLAFPDELAPFTRELIGRNIRWATATLIVAFPVFMFTAMRISRDVAAEPARRNSAIRKWLTYLTLFVAAAIIVGDLIALVFSLLNG